MCGALWATILAADYSERVDKAVFIAPAVGLAPNHPERDVYPFDEPLDTEQGYNSHYWPRQYRDFLEFFFSMCFNEPHSTKQIEDCIGWGLETTPEALADATRGLALGGLERLRERCTRIRRPTLVIHANLDLIRPHAKGKALADTTPGQLVTLEGAGASADGA